MQHTMRIVCQIVNPELRLTRALFYAHIMRMRKPNLVQSERLNTTLSAVAYQQAQELARLRGFRDLNGLLEQLIREDYERRHGPLTFPGSAKPESKKETSGERRDRLRRERAN